MTEDSNKDIDTFLKNMSPQDFLSLGVKNIAYIKPIQVNDRTQYALHGADGAFLSIQDTPEIAAHTAYRQELAPVTVH